ncbi:hypothetical protein Y032_0060g3112 [Ancylostoma ceylanicum]|uniref:Uncharacterized protein n=1 Tax=Ancylostoma ceylanicum TaxID=53326 RepID=A0A016U3J3_9BILA|nr:hypothetical protein Y032_0060g3112 [Ancylostoma ceylanicum]
MFLFTPNSYSIILENKTEWDSFLRTMGCEALHSHLLLGLMVALADSTDAGDPYSFHLGSFRLFMQL